LISIITAMDKNGLIGRGNTLPWHLPNDLLYFKHLTEGKIVIMGKTTYESIGKPLPNRINIILSRDTSYRADGCYVYNSLESILYEYQNFSDKSEEVFIIGGSEVYRQFLPYADKLYITEIDHEFEGDTYFPEIDWDEWRIVQSEQGIKDDRNPYNYYFNVYIRKN
jgi:dihydrofolate reductase